MSFNKFSDKEQSMIDIVLKHQLSCSGNFNSAQLTELHILIDSFGNEVKRNTVSGTGGHLTADMIHAISKGNCSLFHNHPTQGSLSESDYQVLAANENLEMTAVNSRGTTFRGRVINSKLLLEALGLFPECKYKLLRVQQEFLDGLVKKQDFDTHGLVIDNEWIIGKIIGDRLEQCGIIKYECIAKGTDLSFTQNGAMQEYIFSLETVCCDFLNQLI